MADDRKNPQEVLREEILSDAQRQAKRTLQRARREAADIAEKVKAELETWRAGQLDAAQREAQRNAEMILAGLPVEIGRMRADRIETLLQSIYDDARRRLESRKGTDLQQSLINLSAEAIRSMSGSRFAIILSPDNCELLGENEIGQIKKLVQQPDLQIEVIGDSQQQGAGPVIRAEEANEVWDNRFSKRLERLWPALRREVAEYLGLFDSEKEKGDTP